MVVFRSFPILPFLSLFSKLYLPSSSSFHLSIFASLHSSMDPSVTLSVLLINLLSPTAAIDPSIRTHTHPSTCFPSIDVTLTSIRSFICLFVSSFFLRFNPYTVQPLFLSLFVFFLWLIYSEDIYKYHRGQRWGSLMTPWRWSKHLILFNW